MLKGEKMQDFETGHFEKGHHEKGHYDNGPHEKGHHQMDHHNKGQFGSGQLVPRLRRGLQSRWCRLAVLLVLGIPLLVVVVLLITVLVRASSVGSPTSTFELLNRATTSGVNDNKQMERALRLAGALKIPTVSLDVNLQNYTALLQFHDYLQQSFPGVHSSAFVRREVVANYSLVYTVTGSRPGKLPYMLASHLDVVPANPLAWQVGPFSGQIINDTIYGRGALDDKGGVMGILEALEFMISNNERPQRSFYIVFGHDEELGGFDGAQQVANEMRNRMGVTKLDFILDEGFTITRGLLPGPTIPVALIGVSEKGMLTLELSVNGTPGHSSMPPWESPIGILSSAMAKLELHKLPSMLGSGAEQATFEYIAPYTEFGYRMLYGNIWLFSSAISSTLEKSRITNAIVRTTSALTIFKSGEKENVVPAYASAIINHRIHPSQSVADVVAFDTKIVDDPRVGLRVVRSREPSPTSPYGPADLNYQMIARSITQTFDNIVVAPGVMIANTDTLWYLGFTSNIYRFFPAVLDLAGTATIHGLNERISVEGFSQAVSFYHRVIKNADLVYNLAPNA